MLNNYKMVKIFVRILIISMLAMDIFAACQIGCAKCVDQYNCIECLPGYRLDIGTYSVYCYKCINTYIATKLYCPGTGSFQCPDGQMPNSGATACYTCPSTCYRCDAANFCSYCTGSNGPRSDGSCGTCNSMKCMLCDNGICTKCYPGYTLVGGYCKIGNCATSTNNGAQCSACNSGYYIAGNDCYACVPGCLTCVSGENSKCITCNTGFKGTSSGGYMTCNRVAYCKVFSGGNFESCTTCHDGFYLISSTSCGKCSSPCKTCTSTSTTCTSCIDGYSLSGSSCIACTLAKCLVCISPTTCSSCETGYIVDSTTKKCKIANCQTGNSADVTKCDLCATGYYLTSAKGCTICSSNTMNCQTCDGTAICSVCKTGYTKDASNACVSTPANCVTYSGTVCTVCSNGYYLTGSSTCSACTSPCQNCKTSATLCTSCASGYYSSTAVSGIVKCSTVANCETPVTGDFTKCSVCKTGYFLSSQTSCIICTSSTCASCDGTDTCTSCATGKYKNGKVCAACVISQCLACNSASVCTSCGSGYTIDTTSNKCKPVNCQTASTTVATMCAKCESAYYLTTAKICQACSSTTCSSCDGTDTCASCANGKYLSGKVCASCTSPCQNCVNSATSCISCASTYYPSTAISGIVKCTKVQNCEMPVTGDLTKCAACKSTHFLASQTSCLACASSTCSGCDGSDTCTSCASGKFKNGKICSACTSPCAQCFGAATSCTVCISGYFRTGTSCITCAQSTCKNCDGSDTCVSCYMGYQKVGTAKTCTPRIANCQAFATDTTCGQCSTNYLPNLATTACYSCVISQCLTCSAASTCSSCNTGYTVNVLTNKCKPVNCLNANSADNTKCDKCDDTYYLTTEKLCQACTSSTCATCDGTDVCVSCVVGKYRNVKVCEACNTKSENTNCIECQLDGTCTKCDGATYYLTSANVCETCVGNTIHCKTCDGTSICDECEDGYTKNTVFSCVPIPTNCQTYTVATFVTCTYCNDGYFLTGSNTCDPCTSLCQTCKDTSTTCKSCIANYYPSMSNNEVVRCSKVEYCETTVAGDLEKCTFCHTTHFLDSETSCLSCADSTCKECDGTITCVSCYPGFRVETETGCGGCGKVGQCVPIVRRCIDVPIDGIGCNECSSGYYPEANSGVTECITCLNYFCKECNGVTGACTKCLNGYYYNNVDERCRLCDNSCLTCTGTSTSCTVCSRGYFAETPFSATSTTSICTKCDISCLTCCGSGSNCGSCSKGYYSPIRFSETVSCTSCVRCDSKAGNNNCVDCDDYGQCTSCDNSRSLKYYVDGSHTCQPCNLEKTHCEVCDGTSGCDTCTEGYFRNEVAGNTCTSCSDISPYCIYCDKNNGTCLRCDFKGENYGKYFLDEREKCEICSKLQNCQVCDGTKICMTCKPGYYRNASNNNKCEPFKLVDNCVKYDNYTGLCILCNNEGLYLSKYFLDEQSQCELCIEGNYKHCLFCNGTYVCDECDDGFYLNETTCTVCLENCKHCSSDDTCLRCFDGYQVGLTGHECANLASSLAASFFIIIVYLALI